MDPTWLMGGAMGLSALGDVFGGGDQRQPGTPWDIQAWRDFVPEMQYGINSSRGQNQQATSQYSNMLREILSGKTSNAMAGRLKQDMGPQFAMQQDSLRSSFNPRLAGSGAAGSAMANLLGQQGSAMTGNITDMRLANLQRGESMMGQFQSQSQNAYQNAVSQYLRTLGQ